MDDYNPRQTKMEHLAAGQYPETDLSLKPLLIN